MAHVICPPFCMPMSHKHPSDSPQKISDIERLRALLRQGAASPPTMTVDANYFDALHERVVKFTHRPKQKAT
ncbi:hypothetical protein ACQCP0_23075 [Ralstonia pseudosolanacearum]|uniref:hypothetical protein n=1 Tax=Ralstonia pseudosolanacearum TaxID=1310165 RepID=UPI00140317D8|nr:hypothetical protein [Ralstonia pseudosolanacearum]QKL90804.1 hypothetical protein HI802_01025 [Ralstonia solanacearum]QKL95881.1 hypothetical protein HI801_01025 [Ralstonia solanacearum]QLR08998.1 hypothetical protein H1A20_01025 [Ralstonia solanacearum]UNJ29957.1 hypothetical protein MNY32_01105 [Ralstonia pseudosolanacearum]USS49637.1 hypothetical protein NHF34_01240 [Ralstonia solanacearum]